MFLIRNSPHPRGVCMPSSLASRSGTSVALGFGGGLPPRSMMRTKRRSSRSHTSILTGTSGLYLLPCSMAFIVASATAVLSLCRVLSGNPSPLTALATSCVACRSLPGSLGMLSSASVRRAPLVGEVTVPPIFPKVTRVISSSLAYGVRPRAAELRKGHAFHEELTLSPLQAHLSSSVAQHSVEA